jgi:hypothetical protein
MSDPQANILPNNPTSPGEPNATSPGEPNAKARRLAKQLAAEARRRQAVELRLRGFSYEAIAAQLGYKSKSSAHEAVASALQSVVKEPAEKLRLLEAQRLDELWQALWPAARQGDMAAVAGCLKIMERRAKLLALDAPVSVEVSGPETVEVLWPHQLPPEQRAARLAAEIESLEPELRQAVELRLRRNGGRM